MKRSFTTLITILLMACLILAVLAVPAMAEGDKIEDDHSNLRAEIYPQNYVNCLNERYLLRFCKLCSVFVDVNTYESKEHSYGPVVETIKATCVLPGQTTQVCSVCLDKKTAVIGALGHMWPYSEYMTFEKWEEFTRAVHSDLKQQAIVPTNTDGTDKAKFDYKWYGITCYINERYDIYCARCNSAIKTIYKNDQSAPPAKGEYGYVEHRYYIDKVEYKENPKRTVITYKCANLGCPFDSTVVYPGRIRVDESFFSVTNGGDSGNGGGEEDNHPLEHVPYDPVVTRDVDATCKAAGENQSVPPNHSFPDLPSPGAGWTLEEDDGSIYAGYYYAFCNVCKAKGYDVNGVIIYP